MFVVRLAHVEHTNIIAINEFVYWLISLTVNIDAGTLQDYLDGWIFEACVVIVTTIANLQGAVADIWLLLKERVGQILLAAHLLAAFQLERMGCPCTAPSATHLEVHILV